MFCKNDCVLRLRNLLLASRQIIGRPIFYEPAGRCFTKAV
ncbi:hypothetical protein USDA257_p02020 (plasmid) [Sinorhizobium fredii USDA 257]|uniref:Uncharacterized protein n=1 Tax=Sinorhizobium fredii (strain USDA 257) TaxID=1185652 RepID=I3XGB1_SINF2|nr:hypothetical protein USDA257_p02020 [Sinorhizobium fredii USDA 257]